MTEVVLAVSFDPLTRFGSLEATDLFRAHYREAGFTRIEERPPYMPPIERFGSKAKVPDVRFEMIEGVPPTRFWFINDDEQQLAQVQPDWFARNWRKMQDAAEYPRYPFIRVPFEQGLGDLREFVEAAGLGSIKPVQCEITYINHIRPGGPFTSHSDVAQVLRLWGRGPFGSLPQPEQVNFAAAYPIGDLNQPVGRLHISAQPAFRKEDQEPILVVNLTARGAPLTDDLDGVLGFLDIGHEAIVTSFKAITTPEMHDVWEED